MVRRRRPRHACIYLITCISSNRYYIGSSKDTCIRWNSHLWDLINWKHSNSKLLMDWKRYGYSKFTFSILELIEDLSEIRKREQFYIDKFRKEGKVIYNMRNA